MAQSAFLIWKLAIFCQIKEIKHLRGGVVLYAAQANVLIDAELVKKGSFQTETNYRQETKSKAGTPGVSGLFNSLLCN